MLFKNYILCHVFNNCSSNKKKSHICSWYIFRKSSCYVSISCYAGLVLSVMCSILMLCYAKMGIHVICYIFMQYDKGMMTYVMCYVLLLFDVVMMFHVMCYVFMLLCKNESPCYVLCKNVLK